MKAFLLMGLLGMLIGCSKPDYSKPHEYIKAIGYGEGWASTEENKFRLHLPKSNIYSYSELGSGKCEKNLKGLNAEEIYLQMAATNSLIHSEFEGRHDIPIKYAKLQCVAYHGQDQGCETNRLEGAKKIAKNIDVHDAESFLLKTWGECDIKKEIGQVRTFTLDDSKRYKYIPK